MFVVKRRSQGLTRKVRFANIRKPFMVLLSAVIQELKLTRFALCYSNFSFFSFWARNEL